jgi:hypothetical protein
MFTPFVVARLVRTPTDVSDEAVTFEASVVPVSEPAENVRVVQDGESNDPLEVKT